MYRLVSRGVQVSLGYLDPQKMIYLGWFQLSNVAAVNYGRLCNLNAIVYLDDRLMLDTIQSILVRYGHLQPQTAILMLMLIILVGGFISLTKSELVPTKNLEFLGMQLDTTDGTIEVPWKKWKKFTEMLRNALQGWHTDDQSKWLTKKQLEKIRGKGISYLWAMPKAKLYIRQMSRVIAHLDQTCWGANPRIPLDEKLRSEFRIWLEMDQMILKHVWRPELVLFDKPTLVSFTDASTYGWGVVFYDDLGHEHRYTQYIGEDFISLPIHLKEVIIIYKMLCDNEPFFTNRTDIHYCDNQNVCNAFRNLGTPNQQLNDWVTKIFEKLHQIGSIIK